MHIEYLDNYESLKSIRNTSLPDGNPMREVVLDLTGNMERYVWSFNHKVLSEADKILIRKGENVRFIFNNKTMMSHPLHLHGHFFRVLNGAGPHSPLKHTVDVPPMKKIMIEFLANEDRDWFFHCHNLYHMKSGMARVVSYQEDAEYGELVGSLSFDRHWFGSGEVSLSTNKASFLWGLSNTRNKWVYKLEYDLDSEYKGEFLYERNLSRYTGVFAGVDFKKERSLPLDKLAVVGVSYTLPLLIDSEWRVDSEGVYRLGLGSALQLSDRVSFLWDWNTDKEYELILNYELTKKITLSANSHSDYAVGLGVAYKY